MDLRNEILAWASGGADAEDAAWRVYDWLLKRTAKPVTEPKSQMQVIVPEQERENRASDAFYNVMRRIRSGRFPLDLEGAQYATYMSTVLARAQLTRARKKMKGATISIDQRHPDGSEKVNIPDPGPGAEESLLAREELNQRVDAVLPLIEAALDCICSRLAPRWRDGWRLTWRQLQDLCLEKESIEHILERDDGITADSEQLVYSRVRNNLYKRHQRFREDIIDELEDQFDEGSLSADQYYAARDFCVRVLVRR